MDKSQENQKDENNTAKVYVYRDQMKDNYVPVEFRWRNQVL